MDPVQILGLIIIGIVIGVIARLVLPGRQKIGALMTILLGIGGALIGGIIAAAGLIAGAESMGIGEGGRRNALGR
jgi:uncharacterized membrane protein YeaQ/YmgE (transglycosylase-associated protein family)